MAVSNCPMCGHPDYLPRGCCHWREIRRLEAEIDSLHAENERLRSMLAALADCTEALQAEHLAFADLAGAAANALEAQGIECPSSPEMISASAKVYALGDERRFAETALEMTFADLRHEACNGEGCVECDGSGVVGAYLDELRPFLKEKELPHCIPFATDMKAARLKSRILLYELFKATGIYPSRLSQIERAVTEPTEAEQTTIRIFLKLSGLEP